MIRSTLFALALASISSVFAAGCGANVDEAPAVQSFRTPLTITKAADVGVKLERFAARDERIAASCGGNVALRGFASVEIHLVNEGMRDVPIRAKRLELRDASGPMGGWSLEESNFDWSVRGLEHSSRLLNLRNPTGIDAKKLQAIVTIEVDGRDVEVVSEPTEPEIMGLRGGLEPKCARPE
jgi:hypothetical protein